VTGLPVDAWALARATAALAAVVALLVVALWLLRRHGGGGGALQLRSSGSRIAVTGSQAIDARVRLVLVRRDNVEHLLAIGPGGVSVIETLPAPAAARPSPGTAA
jgi:flagellar protein FliO/FliZ